MLQLKASSSIAVSNAVKAVAEDIAKYFNIIQNDVNKEEISEYQLPSFINKSVNDVKKMLSSHKIPVTILGSGDIVIDQYPKINTIVNNKDRVFLVTNNNDFKMPNIIGWSSREVLTLINILDIGYEFEGYGFVTEQSIANDIIISEDSKLKVKLKPKYNLDN